MQKNIYIDLFGLIALFLGAGCWLIKDQKKLMFFASLGSFCWFIHFFLLSAFTASFINLIIALRTFIASKIEKKEHKRIFFLFFFFFFSLITILTWQGFISMIPYLASVISTFSYTFLNNIQMRKTALVSSFLWIYNSYHFDSYYNIFAEIIRTTMILIGISKLKK